MRVLRVLIAEEDTLARAATAKVVRLMGSVESCEEAASCREVVEKCRALKPHVVVLSAKLQIMDALNAVQEMRRLCPKTRVLLLGAQGNEPLERELKKIGDGWVEDPALLLTAIDEALQSELIFFDEPDPKPGKVN